MYFLSKYFSVGISSRCLFLGLFLILYFCTCTVVLLCFNKSTYLFALVLLDGDGLELLKGVKIPEL